MTKKEIKIVAENLLHGTINRRKHYFNVRDEGNHWRVWINYKTRYNETRERVLCSILK